MYKDVQNSNNVDKQMLNQLVNENVIRFPTRTLYKQKLNKIQKGQFLLPFFLPVIKIFKEPIFAERPCIIYFK